VDNSAANKTSLIKAGAGVWTLSASNAYTGTTTVSAGTLVLSGSRASSPGNIFVGNLASTTGTLNIQNNLPMAAVVFTSAGAAAPRASSIKAPGP